MTPWQRNLPKSVLRVQSVCLHIRPVNFQFSRFRRHCRGCSSALETLHHTKSKTVVELLQKSKGYELLFAVLEN